MEESDYLSLPPHKGVARWSTVNLFPHWCNGNYGEVCHVRANIVTCLGTLKPRKVNDVLIPKLPPPPPRSAQKRSGCSFSDIVSSFPAAVTIFVSFKTSIARPCSRI